MVLVVTTGSVDIVSSSSEEEPLSIVMAEGPLLATRKYDVPKGGVPLPANDLADLKKKKVAGNQHQGEVSCDNILINHINIFVRVGVK